MEKVITEWKIVETDEGFRIEVKGDKEHLREWVNRMADRGPLRRARHWRRFGLGGPGCGHSAHGTGHRTKRQPNKPTVVTLWRER